MISVENGSLIRFLQIVLPNGGYVLAAIEAYFDESGTHAGSPLLCVAGYLFEANACIKFDADWRAMLNDFRLPHFHRAPCEVGNPPFDKLDDALRRAIRRRAVKIINEYASCGVVVSVEPASYEKIIPKHDLIGDAYTFCATGCFHAIRAWADKNRRRDKIAYFFEAGAPNQDSANEIMALKVGKSEGKRAYRYKSHSFLLKEDSAPLQAADVLAWHWRDHCLRETIRAEAHEEFIALTETEIFFWSFDDGDLEEFAEAIRTTAAEFPDADPFWEDRSRRGGAVE